MNSASRERRSRFGIETLTSSILLVSAVVGLTQIDSQIEVFGFGESGPSARTFPGLVLGALGLAVLLRIFLHRKLDERSIGPASDLARIMVVAITTLGALVAMPSVGFFLSSALVGVVTAVAFGERRVLFALVLTVTLAACVTYGARHGLQIPLP